MSAAPEIVETPALSPSIAHVLTAESPLHAWTIHRLLGNRPKPVTDAQEKGRLIHALLLEGAAAPVAVIDADDFRTGAARACRDDARARGLVPVVKPKFDAAMQTVERIRERCAEYGYTFEGGKPEHAMEWYESGDVLCHGRIDWLRDDRMQVLELKTTDGSAHPDMCAATLLRSHGVIQDAAYVRALEAQDARIAGRIEVVFLFAQTVEPYAVTPVVCAGSMKEIGAGRWARAVDLWASCLSQDKWPSYVGGTIRVEAPAWALAREMNE